MRRRNVVRHRKDLLGRTIGLECDCGFHYWKPKEAKDRDICDSCHGVPRKIARISHRQALAEVIGAGYPSARLRFLKARYANQRSIKPDLERKLDKWRKHRGKHQTRLI